MSSTGAPLHRVDGTGLRVAVIAGRWHQEITDGLIRGAHETLQASGADHTLLRVSGAFELPVAAQAALENGFDAVVCLAVIVRGGTPHFEFVSSAATDGLTRVALDTKKPVGFGVLTVDTEQQARDRAGLDGSTESKGVEAALAALEAAALLRRLHTEGASMKLVPGTPQ